MSRPVAARPKPCTMAEGAALVLSLGAGVQSSTLALMAENGVLPKPSCAIFADTRSEPENVYRWLDWLESQLSYPVHRVTQGNLALDELRIRKSKKSGKLYRKNSIPAFVLQENGKKGLLGRKCTVDYKIIPLRRKVRELTGIKRAGKGIVYAKMWIGISTDESHRMKPSQVDYIENTFPLIDMGYSRSDCLQWMSDNGYPAPPRSSCYFCPFHSDDEWRNLTDVEMAKSIAFERQLQEATGNQEAMTGVPYLHASCIPLSEVDFSGKPGYQQLDLWGNECEGMCGV